MTRKIGQADTTQIQQATTINLDDFRKMVNYKNTTNKGYVRIAKNSQGTYSLEKINNKIDVPLSMRSNVKGLNNQQIRNKLKDAFVKDMEYLSDTGKTKLTEQLNKLNGDNTKALSRKELQEIFKTFDKDFNTVSGRIDIISKLLANIKQRLGLVGDTRNEVLFMKEVLKLSDKQLETFDDCKKLSQAYNDAYKAHADLRNFDPTQIMKVSEKDFRNLLEVIKNKTDIAVREFNANNLLTEKATGLLASGSLVGMDLTGLKNTVKSILQDYMNLNNIEDVDFGEIGHKGQALDHFVDKVLPLMIKSSVASCKEMYSNEQDVKDNLGTYLNLDDIKATFKEYMTRARENNSADKTGGTEELLKYAQNLQPGITKEQLYVKIQSDREFNLNLHNEIEKSGGKDSGRVNELHTALLFRNAMINHIQKEVAPTVQNKAQGGKVDDHLSVANEMLEHLDSFGKDAKLNNFTNDFMIEKFGDLIKDEVMKEKSASTEMLDFFESKVIVAMKLQYGEKATEKMQFPNGKEYNVDTTNKAEQYIKGAGDNMAHICNKYGGGAPMYDNLYKVLANIFNKKVEDASTGQKIGMGPENIQKTTKYLDIAAKTEVRFRNGALAAYDAKFNAAANKEINKLIKKGNITEEQTQAILNAFAEDFNKAMDNAITRFYNEFNPQLIPDESKIQETAEKMITDFFREERQNVQENFKLNLANAQMKDALGNASANSLLNSDKVVDNFIANNKTIVDNFVTQTNLSPVDLAKGLKTRYIEFVNQQLSSVSIKKSGDISFFGKFRKELDRDFVNSVQNEFISKANKHLANFSNISTKVEDSFKNETTRYFAHLMKGNTFKGYDTLPENDRKQFFDGLFNKLKANCQEELQSLKKNIISHPNFISGENTIESMTLDKFFDESKPTLLLAGKLGVLLGSFEENFNVNLNLDDQGVQNKVSKGNILKMEERVNFVGKTMEDKLSDILKENSLEPNTNELKRLKEAISRPIEDDLQAKKYFYGSLERSDFKARVEGKVTDAAKKIVADYAKLKADYLSKAQKVCDDFAGMDTMTVEATRDRFLNEIDLTKPMPNVNKLIKDFETAMYGRLTRKISLLEKSFKEFSEAIDACEPTAQAYQKTFQAEFHKEYDDYFSKEGCDALLEKHLGRTVSVFRANMANFPDIWNPKNIDVDKYTQDEFKKFNDDFYENLGVDYNINLNNINTKNAFIINNWLDDYDNGFKDLYANDAYKPKFEELFKNWQTTTDGQKAIEEYKKAALNAAWAKTLELPPSQDDQKIINQFNNTLTVLFLPLSKTKAGEEFKAFLAKKQFPDIEIPKLGGGTTKLLDMAEAHFNKHVAEIEKNLEKAKEKNTSFKLGDLLTKEYLKSLVGHINESGLQVLLDKMLNPNDVATKCKDKYLEKPEYKEFLNQMNTKSELYFKLQDVKDNLEALWQEGKMSSIEFNDALINLSDSTEKDFLKANEDKAVAINNFVLQNYTQMLCEKVKNEAMAELKDVNIKNFDDLGQYNQFKTKLEQKYNDALGQVDKVLNGCKKRLEYVKKVNTYLEPETLKKASKSLTKNHLGDLVKKMVGPNNLKKYENWLQANLDKKVAYKKGSQETMTPREWIEQLEHFMESQITSYLNRLKEEHLFSIPKNFSNDDEVVFEVKDQKAYGMLKYSLPPNFGYKLLHDLLQHEENIYGSGMFKVILIQTGLLLSSPPPKK